MTVASSPVGLIQNVVWPNWRKNAMSAPQQRIYLSDARKLIVGGGRYSGKDHIMTNRTLRMGKTLFAQNRDDPPHEGAVVEIGVMAKVSGNYEAVWQKYLRALPKYAGRAANGHDNYRVLEREKKILLFGDGICISFLSLHGDGSNRLGPGYDILHVTEAAFIEERMLRDVVIPLVMRPTFAGYIQLNSTPENNWYDWALETALTKKDESGKFSNYLGWEGHELSSFDNPMLTPKELEEILAERDANYARFRRRYLGHRFIEIPVDAASLDQASGVQQVFPNEYLEKCYITEPRPLVPPFAAFMDVAHTERGDALVIAIMDSTRYLCDVEVHKGTDTAGIVRHLERINRDWRSPLIGYDAQGRASKLAPHVQGLGLRIRAVKTENPQVKEKRVKNAVSMLKSGKVALMHPDRFPFMANRMRQNMRKFRKEMLEFVGEFKPTGWGDEKGYWFYGKPSGTLYSDDIADAFIGVVNLGLGAGRLNIGQINTLGV